MRINSVFFLVTCCSFIFLSSSKADTIFVYGLNSIIASQTEMDLKNSLRKIAESAGHKILIDGPVKKNQLLTTGGESVDWIIFVGHGSSRGAFPKSRSNNTCRLE